jgi:hypothetical protein
VPLKVLHVRGPVNCFVEYDLYTTKLGAIINYDIEKCLFGALDGQGVRAVKAFVLGDPSEVHESFQDFFMYSAA